MFSWYGCFTLTCNNIKIFDKLFSCLFRFKDIIDSTASSRRINRADCVLVFLFESCSVLTLCKAVIIKKCNGRINLERRSNGVIPCKSKISICTLTCKYNIGSTNSL